MYWHMYFLTMYVDFISLQKPVVFREEVTQKSGSSKIYWKIEVVLGDKKHQGDTDIYKE